MGSKNKEVLDSFVKYCEEHPNHRFWQALRNWSGWAFIYLSSDKPATPTNTVDSFYREGK